MFGVIIAVMYLQVIWEAPMLTHQLLLLASHRHFLQFSQEVVTNVTTNHFFCSRRKIHVYKQSSMSLRAHAKIFRPTCLLRDCPRLSPAAWLSRGESSGSRGSQQSRGSLAVINPRSIWSLPIYCCPCFWKVNVKILFQIKMKNYAQPSQCKPG